MHAIRATRRTSTIHAAVAIAVAALLLTVFLPSAALAQDELTIDKYVAAVNDLAPDSPTAVAVAPGDSVTYGIAVSSSPALAGTEVTITDVVAGNLLTITGAQPAGCTENPGDITCVVTLDDAGQTEVVLTFAVEPAPGAGENCQEVVNTARVRGDDGLEATTQSRIEVCPDAAVDAGSTGTTTGSQGSAGTQGSTPGGTGAEGEGTQAGQPGAEGQPNTALPAPNAAGGLLVQIGALLVGAALIVALHLARPMGPRPR